MNQEKIYKILVGAHISEKATIVTEESNQFVFKVAKSATKSEIKEAVERLYEVVVENVSVLNVKGKVKRTARGWSHRANWKKAYVRLEQGHDIDFTSISD